MKSGRRNTVSVSADEKEQIEQATEKMYGTRYVAWGRTLDVLATAYVESDDVRRAVEVFEQDS